MTQFRMITCPAILLALFVLTACGIEGQNQFAAGGDAAQTAEALDDLAQGTIEALREADSAATSAELTARPTETPPPPTPTNTITPSPTLEFVEVEVSVDTNCRSGPNVNFDYVGALLIGESTRIVAQSDTPNYFIVDNPDRPGRTCWLWDRYATVYGDLSRLPLLDSPPTPTPAPASVSGWTFEDVNDNGKRDSGEADDGISGVRLILRVGSCPGGIEAYSVHSDSKGRYQFPVVLAAGYCLTTDPSQTTLKPGQYSISLGSGETLEGMNFWHTP